MAQCIVCHKKAVVGRSRQHRRGVAGKRWKNRVTPTARLFRPNLQKLTIVVEGKNKQVTMCARCIKRRQMAKQDRFAQI